MHPDPLVEAAVRAYLDKRGTTLDTLAESLDLDRETLREQLVGVLEERIPGTDPRGDEQADATDEEEPTPDVSNGLRVNRKLSDRQKDALFVLYDAGKPITYNETFQRLLELGVVDPVPKNRESGRAANILRGLRNRDLVQTVGSKPNTKAKLTKTGQKVAKRVAKEREESRRQSILK